MNTLPPHLWATAKEGQHSGVSTSFKWIDEKEGTRETTAIYWTPGGDLSVLARTILGHVYGKSMPLILDGQIFFIQRVAGTIEETDDGEMIYRPPSDQEE